MPVMASRAPPSAPHFYSPLYSLVIAQKETEETDIKGREYDLKFLPTCCMSCILLPTCDWFWRRTIFSRRLLILLAVRLSKAHHVVLLAGKGHIQTFTQRRPLSPKLMLWYVNLVPFFYRLVHEKLCGKIRQEIKMQSII